MPERFALARSSDEVAAQFGCKRRVFTFVPRYNIAPAQLVAAITAAENGDRTLTGFKWGLVPSWAETPELEHRLSHARAETVAEKAAFRQAFHSRRCIIPASGFFDWFAAGNERTPLYIHPQDGAMFAFAGLWEEWRSVNGWVLPTCTIITTDANKLLAPVAGRMPAILRPEDVATWLDATQPAAALLQLLRPYPDSAMELHPVARRVGSLEADDPTCVEPVEDSTRLQEALFQSRTAAERYHRIFPRSRQVRRDHVAPGGQVFFKTHSFTRHDHTYWHPVVDVETGHVFCDCPDFRYRHARHEPDVTMPQHWCKHLVRAVDNCARHGELRS